MTPAAFTLGLIGGLTVAAVFYIAYKGERHINRNLWKTIDGEELRNEKAFDSGVRMGHVEAELGIVRLDLFHADRTNETVDWSMDDLFPGTTPNDFPRLVEPESPHHSYSRAHRPTNGNSAA